MCVLSRAFGLVSVICAVVVLNARASVAQQPAATNTLVRAVSISRQFNGYAANPMLPYALCVFAERVKQEWLWRLGATDNWRDPIILIVREPQQTPPDAQAIRLEVFRTELGLKYQITCLIPPPLDKTRLMSTLIESLCAEYANRNRPVPKGSPLQPLPIPLWLVEGLTQSIEGRTDVLLAIASRSVAAGRPQTASDLMNITVLPSDNLERQLYEANAWLLTEGLIALPDGGQKLQRFLTESASRKSAADAFWSVYKNDFPQPIDLEKWWGLQVVRRTTMHVAQNLTASETVARLDELLRAELRSVPTGRGKPKEIEATIDALWPYYEERWLKVMLAERLTELEALRSQAHPRYRPVIEHYSRAVGFLLEEKLNRFWRELKKAKAERKRVDNETLEISVYLDRAERRYAEQDPATAFAEYFDMLEKFQALEQRRRNPISDYLDRFDR